MPHKSIGLYDEGQLEAWEVAEQAIREAHDDDLRDGDVAQLAFEAYVADPPPADVDVLEQRQPEAEFTSRVTCQNCGSQVTKQYVRVFAPDGVTRPRACPFCPDKIRTGNGEIRDTRSTRHQ